MNITWKIKHFEDLTVHELYAILRLRSEVFVVEQNCVFLDQDNKDQASHHLMGWQDDRLTAYTRIVPPGLAYDDPSIGRVVTSPTDRGSGIGKILMERSIAELYTIYGPLPIRIGAQLYLKNFYESLGFLQTSEIYDEDGIDHIEMTRK
ncbi:MAG TPA: GNAT family N-acetyltransferase [Chitinophagaceae bacterium]|nr:GNAT family N-acetyltransferase [Chitinophagaceae bacterium]